MADGSIAPYADWDVIIIAAGCSRRLEHLTREIPKPFLPVRGKPIILHTLDLLDGLGFRNVICVVGYKREVFYERLGDTYKHLQIRYVESLDYETTGHGWSLFQTRDLWEKHRRPVLLIHGDIAYAPDILLRLLQHPSSDALAVDDAFEAKTNDEVLVYGTPDHVTSIIHPSFQKVKEAPKDLLGESVGMNKWSASYMKELYAFMEPYFAEHGRKFNWEPVVDAAIPHSKHVLSAVLTGGLSWVNINYEEDLKDAEGIIDIDKSA